MVRRIGRGGRKGQTHAAAPDLRSYDTPPAAPVTVTRADQMAEVVPAQQSRSVQRQSTRHHPFVCAVCGYPITESPTLFSNVRGTRGKPVHKVCDPSATSTRPLQSPWQLGQTPLPPSAVHALATGWADPGAGWLGFPCSRCGALPEERCIVRYSDGSTGAVKTPHPERSTAARRAALPR
ncbi:zinc finger domain-containing protein [Kitasatospora sp. NPDC054768]|uniref:zinc finger domain-containing protein n=2 Tax=Kitasatospora sp. NBC_01519 TaxID=2903576 RepID=UPI003BA908E4